MGTRRKGWHVARWQSYGLVGLVILLVLLWAEIGKSINEFTKVPVLHVRGDFSDTLLHGSTDSLYVEVTFIVPGDGDSLVIPGWLLVDTLVTGNAIYFGTGYALAIDSTLADSIVGAKGRFDGTGGAAVDSSWQVIQVDQIQAYGGTEILIGNDTVLATFEDSIIVYQKVFLGVSSNDSAYLTKKYIDDNYSGGSGSTNADSVRGIYVTQAAPSDAQILKYVLTGDSLYWAADAGGSGADADSIRGIHVAVQAPTSGQVLKYNATDDSIYWTTDATSGGSVDSDWVKIEVDQISPYSGSEILVGNDTVLATFDDSIVTYQPLYLGANDAESLAVTTHYVGARFWNFEDSAGFAALQATGYGLVIVGDSLEVDTTILKNIFGSGSGDIEEVAAGNGLLGGGTSGAVTLYLDSTGYLFWYVYNFVDTTSVSIGLADSTGKIDTTYSPFQTYVTNHAGGAAWDWEDSSGAKAFWVDSAEYATYSVDAGSTVAMDTNHAGFQTYVSNQVGGAGGGDITGVSAGNGLLGGGSVGDVTLYIDSTGYLYWYIYNFVDTTTVKIAGAEYADDADTSGTELRAGLNTRETVTEVALIGDDTTAFHEAADSVTSWANVRVDIEDLANDTADWRQAWNWGDHADAGYLTGNQTITLSGDVTGSGATSITTIIGNDVVDDTMVNWGTNAGQISTDDIPEGTNKFDQALPDSAGWSTAYSWGNHASAGYTDLGQTIESGEITNGTVTEVDLNIATASPADNELLTYNNAGTNFDWHTPAELGLLTSETGDISAVNAYGGIVGGGVSGAVDLKIGTGWGIDTTSNGDSVTVKKADLDALYTWARADSGDITGVTAGNGLTGGGTTDEVTLTVGAGTGITVNAGDVEATLGTDIDSTELVEPSLEEFIEDRAGGLMSGGTHDGITVTYQDATDDIDFEVDVKVSDSTAALADSTIGGATRSTTCETADSLNAVHRADVCTLYTAYGDTVFIFDEVVIRGHKLKVDFIEADTGSGGPVFGDTTECVFINNGTALYQDSATATRQIITRDTMGTAIQDSIENWRSAGWWEYYPPEWCGMILHLPTDADSFGVDSMTLQPVFDDTIGAAIECHDESKWSSAHWRAVIVGIPCPYNAEDIDTITLLGKYNMNSLDSGVVFIGVRKNVLELDDDSVFGGWYDDKDSIYTSDSTTITLVLDSETYATGDIAYLFIVFRNYGNDVDNHRYRVGKIAVSYDRKSF